MRSVTILHVEDNEIVAGTVRDMLEMEGWTVDSCREGIQALKKIDSSAHYDVLLFDNELPDMTGIEIIRYARELLHRRRTPIVMLSAHFWEKEARQAGANAFLRKPDDVLVLAETIARLLNIERT
jgi:two-component system chemotaxis response regulator CheY